MENSGDIFNFSDRQYFSLPFGIISYITQNPKSPDGLLKLQKTCKYFFAKNKIIILRNAVRQEEDYFIIYEHPSYNKKKLNLKNIKYWLTSHIYIEKENGIRLLKNVYRCTFHLLSVSNQNLSLQELNLLIGEESITSLYLINSYTNDENGNLLQIYDYLKMVPNLKKLRYNCENEIFTKETFQRLNSLKFNSKFKFITIYIHHLSIDADISPLVDFIKNNAGIEERSCYRFEFLFTEAENYISKFKFALNKMFQPWNKEIKPRVYIGY